jgi:hypothetical protein
VATNSPGEVALSWADSFIKDLLTEEEKYQDVIKDLSTDAISATVSQLDRASEEYLSGLEILVSRATSSTSFVLVEVDEEVNEDAAEVSKDTDKANKEADEESDERRFDAERATSMVLIEINADIDKRLDETDSLLHRLIHGVDLELLAMQKGLEYQSNSMLDVITEGTITLLTLALGTLLDRFMDAFFEEA